MSRNFVVKVMLVMSVLGMACDDSTFDNSTSGTLRLVVSGLAPNLTNAGQARVIGAGVDLVVPIPAAGALQQVVPIGNYQITYTPPAGHSLAAGQEAQRDVTVTAGNTTEVAYVTVAGSSALRVNVTGLQSGAAAGGSAQVLRTDIGGGTAVTLTIPGAGTADLTLVPGTYRVTFTSPSGYQLANGQVNPQTVDVTAGQTTSTSFAVTPTTAASGVVRVNVTGLVSGASSGGSAAVLRTDIGGQTAVNATIPAAGSVDVTVVAGTYSVTYSPPSGYQLAPGQGNPQTLTVASGQTSTTSFAVSQPPAGTREVLFFSDWRTARGNSLQAVTDGGKWTFVSAEYDQTMNIIASTGLDFPTANVYHVLMTASRSGWSELRHTALPVPAAGQSRYYRWYMRISMPDGLVDDQTHPIQDNYLENWGFIVYNGGGGAGVPNGMWRPEFWSLNSGWPHDRWRGPNLQKNQTYRIEMHIDRTGTTTYRMHVRIYNSANALVADDSAIRDNANQGLLSAAPTLTLGNVNALNGITAGNNGIGNNAPFPFTYGYQGGFAVCADTWCGPYSGTF
jgi:hypothetical protein